MQETVFIADEAAMEHVGAVLLEAMQQRGVVHLQGDLGMGKTTLSRGLLRAAGHQGAVKSPTYTLVEPYDVAQGTIYHFDLYRLLDPEELEYLGIRDYFTEDSLALIEWPDKGQGLLPEPDLELFLTPQDEGRALRWQAHSEHGAVAAEKLQLKLGC
ncbi:tRNA (adenosine(37)-N6)-threonylcarbamoyltransferase complex ATPase subunit type 1 TsaE [Neptunomonas marina]|uniref:tRNA threonylcarbamoyladenosine biosynthesis protein TsaE n=1 Tax=Neptunomonas marina TaxID=1815562 RepID=A0A437Q6I9_9GAMM|nr:tRNA (adenosine(37)-N6)-threonylcarbamoyltransferase complex ATPase subunit type 1 TsaE [Neptunomonas marina]RVU30124.1 tRNA (adenosine(37)-N6)-threonylcarbamoyltransferase complex ATPase subunit type 1 TsaE [Neptunomonas marina]